MPSIDHSLAAVDVTVTTSDVKLMGSLQLPKTQIGIVVFAHGTGSSRFSPRNRQVARFLHANNIGTLLMDLLTPQEEEIEAFTRSLRFNIPLLAKRVEATLEWLSTQEQLQSLRIGLFGASTGAAAALVAAANQRDRVNAVVARGGRPDLAGAALTSVFAPTLLIVGGNDLEVLGLNRQAMQLIPATTQLHIVPGATHLFEEPGALEQVALHATDWFRRFFSTPDSAAIQ